MAPRRLRRNELEQLALEPGETVLVEAERDQRPAWIVMAIVGAGFIAYGVSDPIYGWGVFFLGLVLVSFGGGIYSSIRLFVTDRRIVRIGALGKRSVRRAHAAPAWEPGAFGERLVVAEGAEPLRVRFVKNADAVRDALRAETMAPARQGPTTSEP